MKKREREKKNGNYCIRVPFHPSVRCKSLTPLEVCCQFVSNDFGQTRLGSSKLIPISNHLQKQVIYRLHANLRHYVLDEREVSSYTIDPLYWTLMARASSQCLRNLIHWEGENVAKCIFQRGNFSLDILDLEMMAKEIHRSIQRSWIGNEPTNFSVQGGFCVLLQLLHP